jgi:hypothetical protein
MSLIRRLGQYFVAVCREWVALVSGIVSIALLVLPKWLGNRWPWFKDNETMFICAGVICVFVAGFAVWNKVHPDLRIKIRRATAHLNGFTFSRLDPISSLVILELYLVNARPEPTPIDEYALLVIMTSGRPLRGRNVSVKGLQWGRMGPELIDLECIKHVPLQQGVPVVGHVGFSVDVIDEKKLSGARVVLTVTDGYNGSRKIRATIQTNGADELDRTPPPYMNEAYRS